MNKILKRIITLGLACGLIFTVVGCGNPEDDAKAALDKTMTALATGDMETIVKELPGSDELEDIMGETDEDAMTKEQITAFYKALFSNLSYEAVSTKKVDDETVNITAKVSNINFGNVLTSWLQNIFSIAFSNLDKSEEEITALFLDDFTTQVNAAVEKGDILEQEVTIKMVKTDEGWMMDPSDDVLDAILGGFVKASETLDD